MSSYLRKGAEGAARGQGRVTAAGSGHCLGFHTHSSKTQPQSSEPGQLHRNCCKVQLNRENHPRIQRGLWLHLHLQRSARNPLSSHPSSREQGCTAFQKGLQVHNTLSCSLCICSLQAALNSPHQQSHLVRADPKFTEH